MPATGAYTVTATVGATTTNPAVSEVLIYGIWVTLTLDAAPAAGATVTLAYAPPASNPVQDEEGNDAPAFSGQSVRLGQPPPPPPDLAQVMGVGVAPGNAQLVVTWTAVDTATGYTVQWTSGSEDYNTGDRQAPVTSGSTTRYTIPSLINGTAYTVRVIATRTGATDGPPSAEVTASPVTTPGAPTGLAATANGPSQIDLAWTAPASTGGSAITGYKIEVSPDGSSWSDLVADTGSTDTAYAHMGLDPATTRHYRVSAINAVGTSDASDSDDTTTASTTTAATGAPTITGTAQVGETLTASTTGIADADGLTSPTYTYQWIRVDGTEADIAAANSSTYILVDADLGTTLKVRVTFDDDAGHTEMLTSAATATVTAAARPRRVVSASGTAGHTPSSAANACPS